MPSKKKTISKIRLKKSKLDEKILTKNKEALNANTTNEIKKEFGKEFGKGLETLSITKEVSSKTTDEHFKKLRRKGSEKIKKNKKHLHTTISEKSFQVIKKLSIKYGSVSNVLEYAVETLKIRESMMDNMKKSNLDEFKLWHLMRNDFNMMAVGRRTFLSYITTMPEEPIENNNAIELIEWFYDNRPLNELSLKQILIAIQRLWTAANYFRRVDVEEIDPKIRYRLIVMHDFDDSRYGTYWVKYFKTLLTKPPINCRISSVIRNQMFYIVIERV